MDSAEFALQHLLGAFGIAPQMHRVFAKSSEDVFLRLVHKGIQGVQDEGFCFQLLAFRQGET